MGGNLSVGGTADIAGTIDVVGNATLQGSLGVDGDIVVEGEVDVGTSLTTGARPGVVGGNITCTAPGIFVGNGSGLTNLPPVSIQSAAFTFQSQFIDFGLITPNRFLPEDGIPVPYVSIPCDFFNREPGLYFWKTDAAISIQNLFNSASGFVWWDGTKVSGQTTWNLTQIGTIDNPLYSLTWSYLFYTSLTGFYVQIESDNTSVNPLQPDDYFVNVYKIAALTATPIAPLPQVQNVVGTAGMDATSLNITFDPVVGATFYVATLSDSSGDEGSVYFGAASSPITATGLISNEPYTIRVSAQNATQTGIASAAVVANTNPPGPPTGIVPSNITSNSFDISYTLVAGFDYFINVQQGANPVDVQGPFGPGPITISLYNGNPLLPLTRYSVSITAVDLAPPGYSSSPSVPIIVRTLP